MQHSQIEQIAHEACFATNYETKTKGQQFFYSLCQNITPEQLSELMNNYSETVLFITMAYVHKVVNLHKDPKSVYLTINNIAQDWFTNTASFIRNDRKTLDFHVEKSVGRALGTCLKFIYLSTDERQWVKKAICEVPNPRYRLYLWINFIDAVSVIDRDICFMDYRSLVYTFQEAIIPTVMDNLLPFFQSVRQQIQMNELASNMESTLTLQSTTHHNPHILLFTVAQQKFTDLVFQVLKEIICFNYNITYSEYESEVPIENCLVCYPDQVAKKILSKEFITSIFFVLEKLAEQRANQIQEQPKLRRVNSNQPNKNFLNITLECLSKIALTKMSYVSLHEKQEFIKNFILGINKLLKLVNRFQNQNVLMLLQANSKLLINVELYEIRKFQAEFLEWIRLIRETIIMVINKTEISIENDLLIEALELTTRIVGESVSTHLRLQKEKFKQFGLEILDVFIKALTTREHQLLGSLGNFSKIKSLDDIKKGTNNIFKKVRNLIMLDLSYSLPVLESEIMSVLNNTASPPINTIANIFMLVGDLCELSIFERNILYNDPIESMFPNFGKIVYILIQWIIFYRNSGSVAEILEVSIVIFVEKVCSEILSQFNYENKSLKFYAKLYNSIKPHQKQVVDDQEFLLFCFKQFAISLTNGGFVRVQYTFDVMSTLLLKFKWGLRRQSFKETLVAQNTLELCMNLSNNNFEGQLIKLRQKLFRIITNISFDDILDDYHENIDRLIANLEIAMKQNRWKVLYDLTGICDSIDIPTIYRYFIIMLSKKMPIDSIMDEFFNNCNDNFQIITEIVKLQYSMINNKSNRIKSSKVIRINYMLCEKMMKYWVFLFNKATTDSWEDILLYLYKIAISIITGNQINFFLLQRICPNYHSFIKNMLGNLIEVGVWVNLYPQLDLTYHNLLQKISEELLPIILSSTDQSLIIVFNRLLEQVLEQAANKIRELKTVERVSENHDKILNYSLNIIKNLFEYLRDARKLTHKQTQIRNIEEGIVKVNINVKFDFMVLCFQFGIDNKSKKYLDKICDIIQQMDFICFETFDELVKRLGLSMKRRENLKTIWSSLNQTNINSDNENRRHFLIEIKQWFRQCDSDNIPEPQY